MAVSLFTPLPRLGASLLRRAPRAAAATTSTSSVCAQCRRSFTADAARYSGHNRWSKIKHEKGAADKKKNAERSTFAKHLTLYSGLYGPDPKMNPQLATVIANAKKAGMPKANIDIAVARGQGKSATGERLETALLEVVYPLPAPAPSPAYFVIETESDNKQRSLKDLRDLVKKHGGKVQPTMYLFERHGNITMEPEEEGRDFDLETIGDIMEEAGAQDFNLPEAGEKLTVWTDPKDTHRVAKELAARLQARILGCDIVYAPQSGEMPYTSDQGTEVYAMWDTIQKYPDVKAIYTNIPEQKTED